MGCQQSNNESDSSQQADQALSEMSRNTDRQGSSSNTIPVSIPIDYKARLERKMCLAKETPEPEFDLSDCALKDVPSSVYVLCKVLRKEILDLSRNKLHSLNNGGLLIDLMLLTTLDLRHNQFQKLPDDLCKLSNLRELLLGHNWLEHLPATINNLRNIELLDVSNNCLVQISSINCMPMLRILNISGNPKLTTLPSELSTCDSLIDLILDPSTIQYPTPDIIERGTYDIIRYLATGSISGSGRMIETDTDRVDHSTEQRSDRLVERDMHFSYEQAYRDKMLKVERLAQEKNSLLEAELFNQNERKKQELLRQLLYQQHENEHLVNRIQMTKEIERNRLINDILDAEKKAKLCVENILCLRNAPDPMLLEQERRDEERLLAQLSIQHSDLRKHEILTAMSDILSDEARTIQYYNEQKDATAKEYLQMESQTNAQLEQVYKDNDRDRVAIAEKIMRNEELQKSAVASLIAKNDSRTWGLIEQVRIVESQLAALTHYEIERRKLCSDETISHLAEQRVNLTIVLVELLQQQEKRKQQLLDTLAEMENRKDQETDFWLLQYQKLWDSQPSDLITKATRIDPNLSYQFLLNGVVHCLPFLSKLWQQKRSLDDLFDITDDDLRASGVRNPTDRLNILKSIEKYLHQRTEVNVQVITMEPSPHSSPIPSAPQEPSAETAAASKSETVEKNLEKLAECVICMEESCKMIFLPCGHLCCCFNCQATIELCPLCRSEIQRRIKVIQP